MQSLRVVMRNEVRGTAAKYSWPVTLPTTLPSVTAGLRLAACPGRRNRTADARADAPVSALAVGALREFELPAQRSHGAHAGHHPLGRRCLKRQVASVCAVRPVREGRDWREPDPLAAIPMCAGKRERREGRSRLLDRGRVLREEDRPCRVATRKAINTAG